MAHTRELCDEPADGVLRACRAARRGGDDDARSLPVGRRVTFYHAADCSLCARALEAVAELHEELGFELELIDIGGRPELEARYRELLPALELDGELVFTYFVDADALRARL